MKLLFVHQNFPGQFKHLAPYLAAAGHDVHALTIDGRDAPGVRLHRYKPARGSSRGIHPWAAEFETKLIRGEACGQADMKLKQQGFAPDVIVANPGWGGKPVSQGRLARGPFAGVVGVLLRGQGIGFRLRPESFGNTAATAQRGGVDRRLSR